MVSERERAKAGIVEAVEDDPELDAALDAASRLKLEILKEQNRSTEARAAAERGFFGWLFGGIDHAPTFIAFVAMLVGLGMVVYSINAMNNADEQSRDFWWSVSQSFLAFAGTALGFAVGKTLK
ncbi:MAG: hypothetical protein AAGE90_11435 [Pseudomonadota bacterium]